MTFYQTRPELIEAWLWNETRAMLHAIEEAGCFICGYSTQVCEPWVRSLEIKTRWKSNVYVEPSDWIIKNRLGHWAVVKDEIFHRHFEMSP